MSKGGSFHKHPARVGKGGKRTVGKQEPTPPKNSKGKPPKKDKKK